MSTPNARPTVGGVSSGASPSYGTGPSNPPNNTETTRTTRCATGVRFIMTIHGILNIVIFVSNDWF